MHIYSIQYCIIHLSRRKLCSLIIDLAPQEVYMMTFSQSELSGKTLKKQTLYFSYFLSPFMRLGSHASQGHYGPHACRQPSTQC